ncbi:MAG: hypothetical protein E7400_01745 [Ruminococcaceae bacterium]|nr:hypothetical protein [Oscillospiraceae bacterium]
MIKRETKYGKEFIFKNKFVKNRIPPNDRKLDSFLKFKYTLVSHLHLERLFKKKSWYHSLHIHWGKTDNELDEFYKKQAQEAKIFNRDDLCLEHLVIYDLLPKEYLDDYRNKYIKFRAVSQKKHIHNRTLNQINESFDRMQNSRISGSWHNMDFFAIEENSPLSKYFDYFTLQFIGLTESFFIIKYCVDTNEFTKNELSEILTSIVDKEILCISNDKWWKKKSFAGCYCYHVGDDAKTYALENYILELKNEFWQVIKESLISDFFNEKNIPPSVEAYSSKTLDEKADDILSLLATRSFGNVEYNKVQKVYFIPAIHIRKGISLNNSKIIADFKQFENDGHGLYDFLSIEDVIYKDFADFFVLRALTYPISKLVYQAQRKVNKNVYKKAQYDSLIKLKLELDKAIYFYRRLYAEVSPYCGIKDRIDHKFWNYKNKFANVFDEKHPELPKVNSFETMYRELQYDIKEKHNLLENIYKHFEENAKAVESRYNYKIVKWTLIVTCLSLVVTILFAGNPNLYESIKNSLTTVCSEIKNLFTK